MYGVICDHATAFINGDLKRSVIIHPPGTFKSGAWSVCLCPFAWVHFPAMKFIVASNEDSLVTEFSNRSREIIQSKWYQGTFRPNWSITASKNTERYFETTETGARRGVSTNGTITGKKAHRIIVDDLHDALKVKSAKIRKSDKDWFYTALFDRMIDPALSCITVVGHRSDPDDIQSELIRDGWDVLHIPERWDEKYRSVYPVRGLA